MTKKDLVKIVAEKAEITQDKASKAIDVIVDAVKDALAAGDEVRLVGFGTFRTRVRPAGKGRTFNGELIEIPSRRVPVFKAGAELKKAVQG